METYFDILGVTVAADDAVIKDAYQRCCELYKNDKERLKEVQTAYRVLGNVLKRQRYAADLKKKGELPDSVPAQQAATVPPPVSAKPASKPPATPVRGGTVINTGRKTTAVKADKPAPQRAGTEISSKSKPRASKPGAEIQPTTPDLPVKPAEPKPRRRAGTELVSAPRSPDKAPTSTSNRESAGDEGRGAHTKNPKLPEARQGTSILVLGKQPPVIAKSGDGATDEHNLPQKPGQQAGSRPKRGETDFMPPASSGDDDTLIKSKPSPMPTIRIMRQEGRFTLHAGNNIVGRRTASKSPVEMPLDDDTKLISREHACLFDREGQWYIRSMGKNGTLVNGAQITGTQRLKHEDIIRIEQYTLIFEWEH